MSGGNRTHLGETEESETRLAGLLERHNEISYTIRRTMYTLLTYSAFCIVIIAQPDLPIVLSGDIDAFWDAGPAGVPRSGMRAALFNATTGYSLPEAVRLADDIAALPRLTSETLYRRIRERSTALWRRDAFFRLLNRLLFQAAEPNRRWKVMQRFYRLPEPLIHRFYAGHLTGWDRFRILFGKPPVPIGRALKCLIEPRQPSIPPADAGHPRTP